MRIFVCDACSGCLSSRSLAAVNSKYDVAVNTCCTLCSLVNINTEVQNKVVSPSPTTSLVGQFCTDAAILY